MTEQHYDFVQGFMAAINLYGENPFAIGSDWQQPEAKKTTIKKKAKSALPYEKYLEIPTYIRLGKNLDI